MFYIVISLHGIVIENDSDRATQKIRENQKIFERINENLLPQMESLFLTETKNRQQVVDDHCEKIVYTGVDDSQ